MNVGEGSEGHGSIESIDEKQNEEDSEEEKGAGKKVSGKGSSSVGNENDETGLDLDVTMQKAKEAATPSRKKRDGNEGEVHDFRASES
eukprot:CAMPEP_0202960240 /NCGR_PEP_ID=MMETSP1396-20130829/4388_1 /ASSEMBLY_ACC=CAM_ASM_000872 /TAXON_ID= /ORGANISM="Pseudokeronopsis sp., Strain Brazil" /LENGTH=87 /DNA_ID=CAMNT_0049679327 /DNA_START=1177 /DNA_END=1440 /DNA_ORIENTATION=-